MRIVFVELQHNEQLQEVERRRVNRFAKVPMQSSLTGLSVVSSALNKSTDIVAWSSATFRDQIPVRLAATPTVSTSISFSQFE
jgi:hypothetical protein